MKLFPLALLSAALTVPALAQGGARPAPQRPQRPSQASRISLLNPDRHLAERLQITPEQKAKIQEIAAKAREGVRFDPGAAPGKERLAAFLKAKEAQRKAEAEAEAVLTAEQKKLLDQIRKDADQYPGLGRIGISLAYVPDLTDSQRAKLRQLSDQALQRRGQIVAAFRQQGANGGTAELRQKLRELDRQIRASVSGVLSPEQLAAMNGSSRKLRPNSPPAGR